MAAPSPVNCEVKITNRCNEAFSLIDPLAGMPSQESELTVYSG
jgi:hypothetical protein